MPRSILRKTSNKSKSPNKGKSPKTRKNVVYSDTHLVHKYSPLSSIDSIEPRDPLSPRVLKRKDEPHKEPEKCLSDYTKSTYPCKLKYAVFDNMEEYRQYLLFIHERKLERDDYYNEIRNHYNQVQQKGISIGKSRKSREGRRS